jgi:hypothetical protein
MDRVRRLMPDGVPRYVRCYDDGGSGDRYTVVYTGNYRGKGGVCRYVVMSALPFHPQGIGMHGESREPIEGKRPPAIGNKCHLGRRIPFLDLPDDCRSLVIRDYRELWSLK